MEVAVHIPDVTASGPGADECLDLAGHCNQSLAARDIGLGLVLEVVEGGKHCSHLVLPVGAARRLECSEVDPGTRESVDLGMGFLVIAVMGSWDPVVTGAARTAVVDETNIAKIDAGLVGRTRESWVAVVVGDRLDGQILGSVQHIGLVAVGLSMELALMAAGHLAEEGNFVGRIGLG